MEISFPSQSNVKSAGFFVRDYDMPREWYSQDPSKCWYFDATYLSLRRNRPRTDHFSADQYAAPDNVVLGTDNLSFDFEPGMRLLIGRRSASGNTSVEFSYFGILNRWADQASYTDNNPYGGLESNLIATFFGDAGAGWASLDTFRNAGTQSIEYRSGLHNVELNLQRHFQPWLSSAGRSLVGLRIATLHEDFSFTSYNASAGEVGEYLISTKNTLVGLQMGGDLAWQISPRTALGLWAKGALLFNFSSQESQLINSDLGTGYDLPVNTGDITNGNLASILEVGLSFHWVITKRMEVQAGYEAILLSGLTLATEQFDHTIGLTMARKIDSSGQMLMHGPTIGGMYHW